jgi:hypothetical protein
MMTDRNNCSPLMSKQEEDSDHAGNDSLQQQQQQQQYSVPSTTINPPTNNDVPTSPTMQQQEDSTMVLDTSSHITNTMDSNNCNIDTYNIIGKLTSEETTTASPDIPAAVVPMSSELSQLQQQPESETASTSADILMKNDNTNDEADASTTKASTNMISPTLPSDPMVTDSSASVINEHPQQRHEEEASYINHGYAAWEINRQRWLQPKKRSPVTSSIEEGSGDGPDPNVKQPQQRHAKQINVDEIIDAIFTSHKTMLSTTTVTSQNQSNNNNNNNNDSSTAVTSSNMTAPFPQSVPLPQLIDILQDLWEAESL